MKTCGVCKRPYRSGGGMVHTVKDGTLTRVRACQPCAAQGITVVFGSPPVLCGCGTPATVCVGCSTKTVKTPEIASAIKALKGMHKALITIVPTPGEGDHSPSELHDAKCEGIESAIRLIESGRF